jgi:glycosyltransferase involved in cell wall biosynthesis
MKAAPPAIDWLSPLPPAASGIADYSAELLAALPDARDVRVFGADSSTRGAWPFPTAPYESYRPTGRLAVYHIGNHRGFHGDICDLALKHPGVLVLHEYRIRDLVRERALAQGGSRAWLEELRYALGETGPALARGEYAGGFFTPPLFERLVDRSRGVIVHGEQARRRVLASRPSARVWTVPHHFSPPAGSAPTGDREALGLPDVDSRTLLVGIFGHVTHFKKIRQAVDAFTALHARVPRARLVIVGTPADNDPGLARLLAHPPAGVQVTGRVAFDRLQKLMAAVDVAINLRLETAGETSGTCIRLLGLGRPIIVTDAGWFSEIPDDACLKVRDDAREAATLQAFLLALAERPELRAAIGRNAARWIATEHSISRSLAAYERAFAEAAAAPTVLPSPVPPLAPHARHDLDARLAAAIGAAVVDLGFETPGEPAYNRTQAADLDRRWLEDVALRGREIGLG